MICCLKCFLVCLEKFVQFFNRHTYVEIALRSTNYCSSARRALKVIASNLIRFGILHGLGEIIMNVMCVFLTILGTYIAYLLMVYFSKTSSYAENLSGPLIIVAIICFVISQLFSHIWHVSSDTILHCVCVDEYHEGGRARHPTEKLREVMACDHLAKDDGSSTGDYSSSSPGGYF